MLFRAAAILGLGLISLAANAADYPAPKEGSWIARDFRFHTGEALPEVRLHYRTIGKPEGIPDAIGHGNSTKPSDGLKTKFPQYNYADMVDAQYRLVAEGLGIKHVRMIIGNSMGGMNVWLWGEKYPDYMDVLVPMASQPTAMASRNWILRRMMLESIRQDPEYANGNAAIAGEVVCDSSHSPPPAARSTTRSRRRRAARLTGLSIHASPRRRLPTPTTSCGSGARRATMTPHRISRRSKLRSC